MIDNKSNKQLLNTNKALFDGVGLYGIPEILPINDVTIEGLEPICVNYSNSSHHHDRSKSFLHFFIDDTNFERFWVRPDKYITMLQQYKYVIAPDFSLYTDHPKAVQIFNHYRKHWLARYYQEHGVNIIPCICWSDEESFEFCFDGEPVNSVVATSAVGPWKTKATRPIWQKGFDEMINRLKPTKIIMCKEPSAKIECDIPIEAFSNGQINYKLEYRAQKMKEE